MDDYIVHKNTYSELELSFWSSQYIQGETKVRMIHIERNKNLDLEEVGKDNVYSKYQLEDSGSCLLHHRWRYEKQKKCVAVTDKKRC
jgi:hypothetical protein